MRRGRQGDPAIVPVRDQLVALRKKRGLSQRELAHRLGVSQPVVAEWESLEPRNVEIKTLVRIAAALGAQLRMELVDLPSASAAAGRRRRAA